MRGILVCSALLVVLSSASGSAQDSEEYQALIAEAVAENAAGRYPEALALFRRAHELNPNARTLRALGAVSYEVRAYVDSVRWLEEALTDRRQPLTDEQRAEVQGLLQRAYRFVGRFDVEVEGATQFVLRVDGEEVFSPLVVDIGEHVIEVSADDVVRRREVRVIGGESETLRIDLTREADPEGGPEIVEPPPPREEPSHVLSGISFGIAGAGVGLFAVGAILGTIQRGELDDLECGGTPAGCPDKEVDELERDARIANAGIGIAAVGLTAALIFRFALEREPDVAVSAGRDGASLTWQRSF